MVMGVARRIEPISAERFQLNQGDDGPLASNHQQMGWVSSKWDVSENNRRARYYSITRAGRKQPVTEADNRRQKLKL
jgi:DNA-binding PadR family transcriptional regulator